jgi:hypothetical protein
VIVRDRLGILFVVMVPNPIRSVDFGLVLSVALIALATWLSMR